MSRRQRIVLVLGCVLVGALEAPRALRGVSEAVTGPYGPEALADVPEQETVPGPVLAQLVSR